MTQDIPSGNRAERSGSPIAGEDEDVPATGCIPTVAAAGTLVEDDMTPNVAGAGEIDWATDTSELFIFDPRDAIHRSNTTMDALIYGRDLAQDDTQHALRPSPMPDCG